MKCHGSRWLPDLLAKAALNSLGLRKLQRLATPVRFRPGQTIVVEGEPASEVYGLSQGVGMAPETLTRTFAKLERKQIIGVVAAGVELLDAGRNLGSVEKAVPGMHDGSA